MRNGTFDEVLALLHKNQTKSPLLVAIDGHSAAGKSTLAAMMEQQLPSVTIIHADDFYRPLDEQERESLDARNGYYQYYDWQRLEAQVLKPLSLGQDIRYQKYDWATNELREWASVGASDVFLIEGCYTARPELRDYYDIILWVEASPVTRQQRQLKRADATSTWLARWDAAERYYVEQFHPQMVADLVLF